MHPEVSLRAPDPIRPSRGEAEVLGDGPDGPEVDARGRPMRVVV